MCLACYETDPKVHTMVKVVIVLVTQQLFAAEEKANTKNKWLLLGFSVAPDNRSVSLIFMRRSDEEQEFIEDQLVELENTLNGGLKEASEAKGSNHNFKSKVSLTRNAVAKEMTLCVAFSPQSPDASHAPDTAG